MPNETQQQGNQESGQAAPESARRDRFDFDSFIHRAQQTTAAILGTLNEKERASVAPALDLTGGLVFALASVADSLQRIAKAQEDMAALAKVDIDATIEAAADSLAEERAAKIIEEKTKRSFIGGNKIT